MGRGRKGPKEEVLCVITLDGRIYAFRRREHLIGEHTDGCHDCELPNSSPGSQCRYRKLCIAIDETMGSTSQTYTWRAHNEASH